jgi:tetratricopeptide (TPR) repeat protein
MTSYEQYDYIDEELDRKLARIRKNINNPLFCKSELMKVSELYRNKKDFPHHWAMYTRFARANKNFGNIYGAYKFYKEAARLNPNNYIVNIGLGEVCLIIGNKYENLKPRFYSEANLCFNNLKKNGYQSPNLYSLINNLKTDEEDILID